MLATVSVVVKLHADALAYIITRETEETVERFIFGVVFLVAFSIIQLPFPVRIYPVELLFFGYWGIGLIFVGFLFYEKSRF